MKKPAYEFPCSIEELTPIANFVYTSFSRDLAQFTTFSPDFNAEYQASFQGEIQAAEAVTVPRKFTDELKKITDRQNTNMAQLQKPIDRLEGYVKRAHTNLTIGVKDFGFSALRKAINKHNAETLLNQLKATLQHVDENLEALQLKGFTPNARALFSDLQTAIKVDNQAQNEKINERGGQVQTNITVLNTLWIRLQDVLMTGKIVFDEDQAKKKEYTMAALKKRVGQERKDKSTDTTPSATPKS
jgi:hypothetical protein